MGAPGFICLEDDDFGIREAQLHVGEPNDASSIGGSNAAPKSSPKLVRDFSDLLPGAIYTLSSGQTKQHMKNLIGEAKHLQQAREDEFGRALCAELQEAYPTEVRLDINLCSDGWCSYGVGLGDVICWCFIIMHTGNLLKVVCSEYFRLICMLIRTLCSVTTSVISWGEMGRNMRTMP